MCGKCEDVCPNSVFETVGKEHSAEEIAQEVLKDEIFMKGSGGGVTFSGGEPLMQIDLCVEISELKDVGDFFLTVRNFIENNS